MSKKDFEISKEKINEILSKADIVAHGVYEKCTVVSARLENGFVITVSATCVDLTDYDLERGKEACMKKLESKLMELEAYSMRKQKFEENRKEQ